MPASQGMGNDIGCQIQSALDFMGIIMTVKYVLNLTLGHILNGKK